MEFLVYNKMDNSRSNIDEKPSLARIQSTVAMGLLGDRAVLDLEHKSLVNLGSIAVKKPTFKLSNGSLDVSGGRNAYVTRSCNGVIESIKARLSSVGGLVNAKREQVLSKPVASVNSGLLLMAVMGLLFPAVLHAIHTELHFEKSELALSRFNSCAMLVAYAAYLHFQLKSQRQLCDQEESQVEGE